MTVLPRPINQNIPGQQNVVSINPLKIVKGRWTCLPLAFRFYHMKKTIDAGNVKINGKTPSFQTKFDQAIEILPDISAAFPDTPMLVVADSWFGNDGLFKPMRKIVWKYTHILSRLRANTTLFALPCKRQKYQSGRSKKYGDKMDNAATLASEFQKHATTHSVNLYG